MRIEGVEQTMRIENVFGSELGGEMVRMATAAMRALKGCRMDMKTMERTLLGLASRSLLGP